MAERGNRRAERANEYLNKTGRERIRRLREELQQVNEYFRVRQARQTRPSCEQTLEAAQS